MGSDSHLKAEMLALIPRLRRFACGLTGSLDDADDLVQATCERAIRALDSFTPGSRLDSWLFKIMQNLHYNEWRNTRYRQKALAAEAHSLDFLHDGSRAMDAQLELTDLFRALGQIDADQRAVLLLVAVEGLSYQQVADCIGVPIGTVTSRLARARLKLRALLDGEAKPNGAGPQQTENAVIVGFSQERRR